MRPKYLSQIHINTRLQLFYLFFLKFFCLFLQGLATLLQFIFALQQLQEVGIKHEKVSQLVPRRVLFTAQNHSLWT